MIFHFSVQLIDAFQSTHLIRVTMSARSQIIQIELRIKRGQPSRVIRNNTCVVLYVLRVCYWFYCVAYLWGV